MKIGWITAGAILMSTLSLHGQVQKTDWGKTNGKPVSLYTIANSKLTVKVSSFGARVVSVLAPDSQGHQADVVLGYKTLEEYVADEKTHVGGVVGRYGNRIAQATFQLDGKAYHIPANDKTNALHGGPLGFDRKVWSSKEIPDGVEFTLVSPDGDMGFPGEMVAHVRYTLHGEDLRIDYSATTTKPTVVNLTNHSYFNLDGESSGTVLDQVVTLNADGFTPINALLIPTGEIKPVSGTPFDFREAHPIGERIHASDEQLALAGGYDHNFVLKGSGMRQAASVSDPKSGRTLTVSTTEPGVQFYSGNFLDGSFTGAGGKPYEKYAGFCLETQHYPDSPNHPAFPSTTLLPGQTYHTSTIFHFGVVKP